MLGFLFVFLCVVVVGVFLCFCCVCVFCSFLLGFFLGGVLFSFSGF